MPKYEFDPYDALATIVNVLQHCEDHPPDDGRPRDGSVHLPYGDAMAIRNQVYALRAYVTGVGQR